MNTTSETKISTPIGNVGESTARTLMIRLQILQNYVHGNDWTVLKAVGVTLSRRGTILEKCERRLLAKAIELDWSLDNIDWHLKNILNQLDRINAERGKL